METLNKLDEQILDLVSATEGDTLIKKSTKQVNISTIYLKP